MFACCCAAEDKKVSSDVVTTESTFDAVEALPGTRAGSSAFNSVRDPPKSSGLELAQNEFTVALEKRTADEKVGLDVAQRGKQLFVKTLKDGMLAEWNIAHPDLAVKAGDRIVSINGRSGNPRELLMPIVSDKSLIITLARD